MTSKRVIELGEELIDRLNLQGNGGPDEIVFFSGKFQTWALDGESIRALRGACVDEKPVRLYAEIDEPDDE